MLITILKRTCHPSLSWAISDRLNTYYASSLRPILILSSYFFQGFESGMFSSDLPTETLHAPSCPPHANNASSLICLLDQYFVRSISNEFPRYGVSFRSLSPSSFQVQGSYYDSVYILLFSSYDGLGFTSVESSRQITILCVLIFMSLDNQR